MTTENLPALQEVTSVGFTTDKSFELAQRVAKAFSSSSLVPKIFQGPNGIANCMIALNMAHRMGADPLMVIQNLYVVQGKPSFSSQFLIATFNACGRFTAIRYEFSGKDDDYGCYAYATEKETGEQIIGTNITIGMAKKERWFSKDGSKWPTMPEQMLRYRAAAFLIRAYAPEIAMGLSTLEEMKDTFGEKEIIDISNEQTAEELNKKLQLVKEDKSEVSNLPEPDKDPWLQEFEGELSTSKK